MLRSKLQDWRTSVNRAGDFLGWNTRDLWCPPKRLPWMINYSPAVGPWGCAKTASGPFPSIAELEQMSVQGTQLDGIWGLLSLGLWKVKLVTFLLKHSDSEGRSEKRVWCLFIQKKRAPEKLEKNGNTILWSLRKELDFWKWRELPQPKPLKTGTFEQVWCWFLG